MTGISRGRARVPSAEDMRERYGLLLVALLGAFAVQGIAEPGPIQQVIVSVLLATTLLLSLWAADAKPAVTRMGTVVSAMIVAASVIGSATGNSQGWAPRVADLLLVTLCPAAIVTGVLRTLRERNSVTVEAVFGVLCLYILLGMFFAFVYGVIGLIHGSFFAQQVHATTARYLYFSFTTLTTVGYGDLTAASNLGHTLSVSEALFGQVYLVTVVSIIVGNLSRNARRDAR